MVLKFRITHICSLPFNERSVHLKNIPNLSDIRYMIEILEYLGAKVENPKSANGSFMPNTISHIAPYELVRKMRASVCLLGPLVSRLKKARSQSLEDV